MELTQERVERAAREYADEQPLYAVEAEHVEMLPDTFDDDDFGWRDAEWVVQWYYRRHLGAYPDAERREREAAYGDNDFDDILETLPGLFEESTLEDRLAGLTDLEGVDVPVASAFLQFSFPDTYLVIGEREWETLRTAGELDDPYPDPPSVEDYERYMAVCGDLLERFGVDAWTLYRALWRLSDR